MARQRTRPVGRAASQLSTPTTCAEEDNVSIALSAVGIRQLRVEALQPPYIAAVERDGSAPDFSGCDFDGASHLTDPRHDFEPRVRMLHQDRDWRLVGRVLPQFWRPQQVPVQVGRLHDRGFHLLQLLRRIDGQFREVLVLYPADGYWRLKPLPLAHLGDGVYGSSLLLGPVTQAGRPVVEISHVHIEPRPMRFHLRFAQGGSAVLRVVEASRARTAVDLRLNPAVPHTQPFAMLRSMHVAPDNADVSEVRWRDAARAGRHAPEQVMPLSQLNTLQVRSVVFGRSQPSRHNTSAPDIRLSGFAGGPARPAR
ncbi:hypothetical protein PGB34_05050 [Xenophilus arseniciresistens]|uniref:Uncharacterized protein n=1 Tax=Xenophilus arseniciresistens TaxID=1283306 RepID=A0AAE3N9K6_9BURK|nr:hypothetical protein [Xenophilus arseniciresistens]MDA7415724.1 hypothetical protein [Xenophilus arseniciresistens]